MKHATHRSRTAALCVLTAVASFNAAYAVFQRELETHFPDYEANNALYGKLGEIRTTVDEYYVGEYDAQQAVDMACVGYLAGVGDRWSSYLSAEEYAAYVQSFNGESTGVGIYVSYSEAEGVLRIIEAYPDSDAAAAGLQRGDQILGAGGKTLAEDGYDAVVEAIGGEEGTTVDVTVLRQGADTPEVIPMERKTMETTMVTGKMLDETTGYLYIYNFHRGSEEQFETVLRDLLAQGAEQLIFDVRNCPGGAVDSLCEMLDLLLPEGDLMTLRSKAGEEKVYTSDAEQLAAGMPMAVLVNADSISAAEFFAAALQEYGRAVIVGEQTIGKGYSQRNYVLSDGSALHLSDQAYFTPEGRSLIGTGVTPDVEAGLPAEKAARFYFLSPEEDEQLAAARAALGQNS